MTPVLTCYFPLFPHARATVEQEGAGSVTAIGALGLLLSLICLNSVYGVSLSGLTIGCPQVLNIRPPCSSAHRTMGWSCDPDRAKDGGAMSRT